MIDFLNNLSGCELVALSSLVAITLSQGLTPDEIDTLGNFLSSVGSDLTTIASAQANECAK